MSQQVQMDDLSAPISADALANADLLDNPIWNSLRTEHGSFAEVNGEAHRYPAAIGPLSGIPDQSAKNYDELRELAGHERIVVLFCKEKPAPGPGWTLIRGGLLSQLVCVQPVDPGPMVLPVDATLRRLSEADVPAMVALAELTEPGPFRQRTIELGAFFGIFHGDRLVAMAGQRTHLPRHVEVSAVCTHPDARGRGYARVLIATVADEIRSRGKTPFLHSFADNHAAIRVYEGLGFVESRNFELAVLRNDR